MTLPFERVNAVNETRNFLFELIRTRKYKKIALRLLKHYPTNYDTICASAGDTSVFKDSKAVYQALVAEFKKGSGRGLV